MRIIFNDDAEGALSYILPVFFSPALPPHPDAIPAQDYLRFAKVDLSEQSERGLINGLSNAKRALHLIVDQTLNSYGLYHYSKKASFPDKLSLLDETGLLPISILNQLNIERNSVEHEYSVPTRQRVSEAIDVGNLLLLASLQLSENVPSECVIGLRTGSHPHAILRLHSDIGELRIYDFEYRLDSLGGYNGIPFFNQKVMDHLTQARAVKVSPEPFSTISIKRGNANEWGDIVRHLISLMRAYLPDGEAFAKFSAHGYVSTHITIPMWPEDSDYITSLIKYIDTPRNNSDNEAGLDCAKD